MRDRHIAQVALCAHNARYLRRWYSQVFDLAPGGGVLLAAPPLQTKRIQGIHPNPAEKVTWLVDRQDYFQLEFFQFYRPRSRLRPPGQRPCDIGYNMIGLAVADFDATLHRFAAFSDRDVPVAVGEAGARRSWVRDPEGNWIAIMERDPIAAGDGTQAGIVRPELGATVRSMRLSVPDLAQARATYVDALGLTELDDTAALHGPEDEAHWGLAGATARRLVVGACNFVLELVEYRDPSPRPWPEGYQICDQGFMNIALGFTSAAAFDTAFAQATAGGMSANGKPVEAGLFRVMYVNDAAGFSVELLYARRHLWGLSGFAPGGCYVANEVTIDADPRTVWDALADHAAMGTWTPFHTRVVRQGDTEANGSGCLRQLRGLGLRLTEEVIAWDEGRHYRYRLRSGAPFRWHCGDVYITANDDGPTAVRWVIRFECALPLLGKPTAWLLKQVFGRALRKLKANIETPLIAT